MNNQELTIEKLFIDACGALNEPPSEVQGKCRKAELTIVRCIFCYVAYFYTNFSIRKIGNIIGGRDHTTAINQRDVAIDLLHTNDPRFIEKFNEYKNKSLYFRNMRVIRLPRKLQSK